MLQLQRFYSTKIPAGEAAGKGAGSLLMCDPDHISEGGPLPQVFNDWRVPGYLRDRLLLGSIVGGVQPAECFTAYTQVFCNELFRDPLQQAGIQLCKFLIPLLRGAGK